MLELQTHYKDPRELSSSRGFRLEYDPVVTNQELREDIISYLGEYRFELQKYDYQLVFSYGNDGEWRLRDPHRFESMGIKAARSIKDRRLNGESTHREEAEAIGIRFLEKQLEYAMEGNTIVWASPPGSKDEGYGDYGFFFVGQVKRSANLRKEISMTAIRVEYPTLPEYGKAFKEITGSDLSLATADDFIRHPLVINESLSESFIDGILADFIIRNPFQKERFKEAIARLGPRIDQFISRIRWGTKEEKRTAFHALENYALQIKKGFENGTGVVFETQDFEHFVNRWGYEPPKAKGSCPIKSENILAGNYSTLNKILNQEWFTCPKCNYQADGPVGNTCPGCGLTKEKFAEEGGKVC